MRELSPLININISYKQNMVVIHIHKVILRNSQYMPSRYDMILKLELETSLNLIRY